MKKSVRNYELNETLNETLKGGSNNQEKKSSVHFGHI